MWGDVYGLLATALGYTWEYIDEHMTFPRFDELTTYWAKHPPVHISVAAYLGWGSAKAAEKPQDISELMHDFPMRAG